MKGACIKARDLSDIEPDVSVESRNKAIGLCRSSQRQGSPYTLDATSNASFLTMQMVECSTGAERIKRRLGDSQLLLPIRLILEFSTTMMKRSNERSKISVRIKKVFADPQSVLENIQSTLSVPFDPQTKSLTGIQSRNYKTRNRSSA